MFLNKVESMTKKVEKFLGPIITERLEKDAKYGPNWEGRPVCYPVIREWPLKALIKNCGTERFNFLANRFCST